jgi:hypothetical protein
MERNPSSERHEWRHSARVQVAELVSSRYEAAADSLCEPENGRSCSARPLSWDERVGGVDIVTTVGGDSIKLFSSPMQSPPKPGWVILLTGGNSTDGYTWTLYGIPPRC